MKRTTAPGSSGGLWVDRNVGTGVAGTSIIQEDYNNLQEEICNAITGSGIVLSGADQSQLSQAISARIAALSLTANTTINITTSMTLAQVQAAINLIPKDLGGFTLTIQFADGTYQWASYVSITGFYNGIVNIQGNTADTTVSATKSVNIEATGTAALIQTQTCSALVNIRYIRFYGPLYTTTNHYMVFGTTGTGSMNVLACALEGGSGVIGRGLYINRIIGASYINTCYFTNLSYGSYIQFSTVNMLDNIYNNVTTRVVNTNGIVLSDLDEPTLSFIAATQFGGLTVINGEIRRAPGYNYYDLFTLSGAAGSVSSASRLYREGALLQGQLVLTLTGVCTGDITITAPTGMTFTSTTYRNVGSATFYDASTATPYDGRLKVATTSTLTLMTLNANQTWGVSYPVAAANGDSISINVQIPIAEWD